MMAENDLSVEHSVTLDESGQYDPEIERFLTPAAVSQLSERTGGPRVDPRQRASRHRRSMYWPSKAGTSPTYTGYVDCDGSVWLSTGSDRGWRFITRVGDLDSSACEELPSAYEPYTKIAEVAVDLLLRNARPQPRI
jgi:hypothetical protein